MAKTTKQPSHPKPNPSPPRRPGYTSAGKQTGANNRPVSRQKKVTGTAKPVGTRGVAKENDYYANPRYSYGGGVGNSFDDAMWASDRIQRKSGQNYNTYGSGRGLANTTVVKQSDINTGAYRKRKGH